jgi:hypothetical protein
VAVAVVVDAAAVVASCCSPVATTASCGGSPVVAALLTAHGTLEERRLVGTNASDLSALAGARAGMVGATLRTRRQEIELQPLETGTSGGATAYLKVEKSRFLFLEGSAGAAVRSSCPSQRSQMLPRCSPAPSRCALPLPRTARRRALPRPPRAPAPLPLRWLLVRGARDSTSQGGPPPISLLFFLLLS